METSAHNTRIQPPFSRTRLTRRKSSPRSLNICVFIVFRFEEQLAVREPDNDRVPFHQPLLHDPRHDFVSRKRAAGLTKHGCNDVRDDALAISPFFQSVDTASHEHKSLVLDKLVMHSLLVRRPPVKALLVYHLSDLRVMLRLVMVKQHQIRLVPDVPRADFRPSREAPITETVFRNSMGERQVVLQNFVRHRTKIVALFADCAENGLRFLRLPRLLKKLPRNVANPAEHIPVQPRYVPSTTIHLVSFKKIEPRDDLEYKKHRAPVHLAVVGD